MGLAPSIFAPRSSLNPKKMGPKVLLETDGRLGDKIGSSVFSPLDISGLLRFGDPNVISTLWTDSARTTQVSADGNSVGASDDQSSNSNHATQGTTAAKPTYKTSIFGSKPGILYATDDYLPANAVATSLTGDDKPFAFFAVIKKVTNATGDTIMSLTSSSANGHLHELQTNSTPNYRVVRIPPLLALVGGTPDTSAHVVEVVFTGTAVSVLIDGTAVIDNQAQDADPIIVDRFTLGSLPRFTANESFFEGYMGPELIYDSVLSADDRTSIRNWLTAWAGL